MTEIERLTKRMADMGVRNFNALWGDKAHLISAEERAAELNKSFDRIEAGDFELVGWPKTNKPMVDVSAWLADQEKEKE